MNFLAKEETETQKTNDEHKNTRTVAGVKSSIISFFQTLPLLLLPKAVFKNT